MQKTKQDQEDQMSVKSTDVFEEGDELIQDNDIINDDTQLEIDPSTETHIDSALPPGYWKATDEEVGIFKSVDRKQEDEAVYRYQKLRDAREGRRQELFGIKKKNIETWASYFREIGRTQEIVQKSLMDALDKCLIHQENNRGISWSESLESFFVSSLKSLASKNDKQKSLEKLIKHCPRIDTSKEEAELLADYLELVDIINDLVGKLYAIREPTMRVWARRYHYLAASEEDMLAELRFIWMKCVNEYEFEAKERVVSTFKGRHVHSEDGTVKTRFKRTSFNTYKFTSFRNFIVNQMKRKYKCKKRIDENEIPFEQTMMSLDRCYDDEDDADGGSMYDTVACQENHSGMSFQAEMLIDRIAGDDVEIRTALEKLVYDPQVKTLETACRLRDGSLEISDADRDFIYNTKMTKDNTWRKLVKKLIENAKLFKGNFTVNGVQVWATSITFEVKVQDSKLLTRVKKAIAESGLEQELGSI